jgi:hypothetical protein
MSLRFSLFSVKTLFACLNKESRCHSIYTKHTCHHKLNLLSCKHAKIYWFVNRTPIEPLFTAVGSTTCIISTSLCVKNGWLLYIHNYNIAFVNSERWLAKSCVDITQCQRGNVRIFLSLYIFPYWYIVISTHSWELGKLEIVWKHSALRESCSHTISRFPNFHSCWYNCISTRKMFYIC